MRNKNLLSWLLVSIIFLSPFIIEAGDISDIQNQEIVSQPFSIDEALLKIIDNLDTTLNKLGNRRLAVIGFVALDVHSTKDAVLLSERLVQYLISSGKFEVVEKSLLGAQSISDLNVENSKKWTDTLKLGSVITGTVFRKTKDIIQLNWRVVELKNLTILTGSSLEIKTEPVEAITSATKKVTPEDSPLTYLKQKIDQIKASSLAPKEKEETIIKTIAEYCKPNPNATYNSTFFSCDLTAEYCSKLNLRDGFYKIYYNDEFVITVDKNGNILESYYYGKNNPVRKDINLNEFLKNIKSQ